MSSKRFWFIMLFPYIIVFCFLFMFAMPSIAPVLSARIGPELLFTVPICAALVAFTLSIVTLIQTIKGKYGAQELAKANKIVKLVHIPAYVIYFLFAIFSILFLSIWGIGVAIVVVLIDVFTIIYSGSIGLCAAIAAKKENVLPSGSAVLYAIMSFIYCVDVFAAVIYNSKIKKTTLS